jgi:hypothetical protein
MCDQIVNLVEQINGGAIKAYAIATTERSPVLPNVPTTVEAGLCSYHRRGRTPRLGCEQRSQPLACCHLLRLVLMNKWAARQ